MTLQLRVLPDVNVSIADVPIGVALLDGGEIRAFAVAGKTDVRGTIVLGGNDLQALFAGKSTFLEPTSAARGMATVVGGRRLRQWLSDGDLLADGDRNRLKGARTEAGEWEFAEFVWSSEPVTCQVPFVPLGGVTSDRVQGHRRGLLSAVGFVVFMAVAVLLGGPSRRVAGLPLLLGGFWLVNEVGWRWRHTGAIGHLAAITNSQPL